MKNLDFTKLQSKCSDKRCYYSAYSEYYLVLQRLITQVEHMSDNGMFLPFEESQVFESLDKLII